MTVEPDLTLGGCAVLPQHALSLMLGFVTMLPAVVTPHSCLPTLAVRLLLGCLSVFRAGEYQLWTKGVAGMEVRVTTTSLMGRCRVDNDDVHGFAFKPSTSRQPLAQHLGLIMIVTYMRWPFANGEGSLGFPQLRRTAI